MNTIEIEIKKIRNLDELNQLQSGEKIILVREGIESCPVTYWGNGEMKERFVRSELEYSTRGVLITKRNSKSGLPESRMNLSEGYATKVFIFGIYPDGSFGNNIYLSLTDDFENEFKFNRGEYFK